MQDKQTILIVDDIKENIDILVELLNRYDLITAIDAKVAIDTAMEEKNIDLILLDIMMPNMNGFEVCKVLKKSPKTEHIPIIFLSAKDSNEDIKKGFETGGVDYITKPFNPDELISRVNTHLKLRAYEKNLESRVQEEIQKNKIKEQMIYQQSKQAALGELLMHIAHQWKQPLTSLSSINVLNKAKINLGVEINKEDMLKAITKTEDIIMFMSETIDTFKNFYEPSLENKEFSITDSIIDILTIIEGTFYYDNIKIYITSNEEKLTFGNVNEFSQAILSILNNSRDIFKIRNIIEPEIHIAIKNQKVTIEDNGGGIKKELLDDVFLPNITTKGSSGIGLYISKILIEKNNGVITVENTKKGVMFTIEFITWIN
ncbi:MAG: histidine kinase [Sulfurimonas sp. RIFOXYD12_FULL_33_39]|uniref:hybrid sensor histidine kinase/response regulator n=1 Tax=unclassified Sulfurimonas TaxID=2623549 RepID=UPI0008D16842|nr:MULTISPECIES: hybrid sensor histidine kinase/response regulator [unclassified Sulfurimonas]OHE08852.1 MAG: histidine kinase [Sulfurimonas sp. RIFOXYD12_FULL_33_39]OHE14162.1 MAG: histidine kinase [Sulfurimonas sp. RIFOXYD2_FULL_34_21]